jgi:WD40 repeat protein
MAKEDFPASGHPLPECRYANEIIQDRFIFRSSLVLDGHSASINTLSISADGSLLLSGGD